VLGIVTTPSAAATGIAIINIDKAVKIIFPMCFSFFGLTIIMLWVRGDLFRFL